MGKTKDQIKQFDDALTNFEHTLCKLTRLRAYSGIEHWEDLRIKTAIAEGARQSDIEILKRLFTDG